MSLLDDGSNNSILTAAVLLFILGATLTTVRALRTFEPNADLPDADDLAAAQHSPWGQP